MIRNLVNYFKDEESRTAGLFFSVNSIFFGSWITRLPDIQERIGLSEGELGLALLGLPLGSVSVMPFISYFIQKYGAGRVTIFISVIFCVVFVAFFDPNDFYLFSNNRYFNSLLNKYCINFSNSLVDILYFWFGASF